MAGAQLPAH